MLGMPRLLFKLRHVEADEFDEVTTALDQAGVDWYQTSAGLLGFSAPALWLRDAADYERARAVIALSQQQRVERLRQAWREQAPETFTGQLRRAPLQVLGVLLLIVLIIGLVLWLPWLLWR